MVSAEEVKAALEQAFPGGDISVTDMSGGCGTSFEVSVVSERLAGKKLLERHRTVNEALAALMPSIHALRIAKAAAPPAAQQ